MTHRPFWVLPRAFPFFALFAVVLAISAGEPRKMALSDVPGVVRNTILAQAGTNKLGDIEREEDDGDITYTVELDKNGVAQTFSVDEEGVLQSVEIGLEETPAAVRKVIETQLGQGELDSVEKTYDEGRVTYDVEMTTTNGLDRSFSVATNGVLERLQIALEDAPAAVQKIIKRRVAQRTLGDLYRVLEDGELSYEANYFRDGHDRDFSVAPDGKLQSEQVFLSEVPPPAQETIRDRISGGKILRIDHVFELRMGVFPYEVEGRKVGKPFNFSVGPKGRFLGMDE